MSCLWLSTQLTVIVTIPGKDVTGTKQTGPLLLSYSHGPRATSLPIIYCMEYYFWKVFLVIFLYLGDFPNITSNMTSSPLSLHSLVLTLH